MERNPAEIIALWDKYLGGGVVLSEYSTFLAQDAETAWSAGADIATILAATSAIETHLKFELRGSRDDTLQSLTKRAKLSQELCEEIDQLRHLRNKWVHVRNPENDTDLQLNPAAHRDELARDSRRAIEAMIRAFCAWQMI